jgi:sortase A
MGSPLEPIPVTEGARPIEPIDRAERAPASLTTATSGGPDNAAGRPARLRPLWRTVREIGYGLITAGLVVLLFVAYQLWGTGIAEANSQRQLKRQFDQLIARPSTTVTAPSTATTPTTSAPVPPTGNAVAHLVIPKIGVDKFVVEGVGVSQLRKGPGHYSQTPLPGQQGNAAIAGHRTTYGAPFYRLNELRPGDDIYATTSSGHFRYSVTESKVVKPSDVSVLEATLDSRLTLTTCTPRYSASRRLVVVSQLIGTPAPGPPAGSSRTPAGNGTAGQARDLGSGDSSAWPPTILFGLLALGLWIVVRILAARSRKGLGWAPFLIGIPICLIPLWFFFENASRLLPPSI